MMRAKVVDIAEVTDFVASGSFASLRENVQYLDNDGFAYLIRLTDFNNNWKGPFVYVSESSYNFLKKSNLSPRDLIISNVGAYCGKCFLAPKLDKPITVGPNSIVVRSKSSGVNQDFLYYLFASDYGQNLIKSIVEGSAIPKFNKTNFRNLEVELPELKIQLKAVEILKALDDKIELNNQMNETLEAMARAIFKEWFIDFGPVRAKAEGRRPFGMDDETAALFPDSFEESELGMIPKGWDVKNITEFCSLEYGKNLPTTDLKQTGFPVYGASGVIGYYDRSLYKRPQVLITCRGNGSGDILETKEEAFVTNNSIAIVPQDQNFRHFLRHYLKSIDTKVVVTGSAQPQITIANLSTISILIPNEPIYNSFSNVVEPLWQLQRSNEIENKQLSSIRDILLPKMITGELILEGN